MDKNMDSNELPQLFFAQIRSFYRRAGDKFDSSDLDVQSMHQEVIEFSGEFSDLRPIFGGDVYTSIPYIYDLAVEVGNYTVAFQNLSADSQSLFKYKYDVCWIETFSAQILYMLARIRTDLLLIDEVTESERLMSLDFGTRSEPEDSEIATLASNLAKQFENEPQHMISATRGFARSYVMIRDNLHEYKRLVDEFVSVPEEQWNDVDFAISVISLQTTLSALHSAATQSWPSIFALTSVGVDEET